MLRPGTYGARGGTLAIDADDVTVAGAPGAERPSVLGAVLVRGDRVRLRHLLFNGPTGPVLERTEENPDGEEVQVAIEGDGVEVSDCEVRDNRWHAGIYLSGAEDVRLLANHIHHNGAFGRSEQANLDHGIYFGSGSGLVANNVVEKNLAHGVQLYPRARGVVVAFNTIARNGKAGVILAEEAADNLVVSNLIVANGDNSIRSSDLEGSGNVARRNLVWANGSGNLGADATNLLIEDNIQADPLLDGEYRPRDKSPALDAGERVPGVERDRDGVPRPQGEGPDLGAYERE